MIFDNLTPEEKGKAFYEAGFECAIDRVLKIIDSWKEFHMGTHKSVLNMISNEVLALKGEQG